ncbi:MAG: heme exporter protein CcmB [Alphaproteobacteria bacterium]|jgi:heme exporter protein B|nr:heme exporter protein CcmB [Alphaproteobacteria bacterium]MBP9877206.1 heme exporter protein CcmB [Alphaproteobacteria bacterium]
MIYLLRFFILELKRQSADRHSFLSISLFFLIFLSVALYAFQSEGILSFSTFAGLVWLCILLSSFLALDFFFEQDEQSGLLDFYLTAPISLAYFIFCRSLSIWSFLFLPLILISSFLAALLGFTEVVVFQFGLSLVMGSFILLSYLSVIAALLVGVKQTIYLLGIVLLPLLIPLLLLEMNLAQILQVGEKVDAFLWILGGISIMLASVSSYSAAWVLRKSKE